MAIETAPLFAQLEFGPLLEYDVFTPSEWWRTRVHGSPDRFDCFLHYYRNLYSVRLVTRERRYGLCRHYCGLDKPPSMDTVDQCLTNLECRCRSHPHRFPIHTCEIEPLLF